MALFNFDFHGGTIGIAYESISLVIFKLNNFHSIIKFKVKLAVPGFIDLIFENRYASLVETFYDVLDFFLFNNYIIIFVQQALFLFCS